MHALCALSTLFLSQLLPVQTAVLSPFDIRNQSFVLAPDARNSSNDFTGSNSLPTSIHLIFDLFGSQIPSSAVNTAFNGAITRIDPFFQSRPNDPITNNDFQYRAVGGSVQISVTVVPRQRVSWQQLNVVLRQAATFMNGGVGASRQHMQELSFEIITDGTRIGDGLVSYYPSLSLQFADSTLANLTNPNDTGVLSAAMDRSIPTADPIAYPIPNSPFTLVFDFFGNTIPTSNVCAAFEGVYLAIFDSLSQHPASPISIHGFEYEKDGVRITVLASKGVVITWQQLSCILGGLYGFMSEKPEHYQHLTCGIVLVDRYSVGLASIGYVTPRLEVAKRALLNNTVSLPPLAGVSGNIPFPVPETPIIMTFTYLGTSIPRREVDEAIWAAMEQIGPSYRDHGTDPVPGNHFFLALKGVRIAIFANVPLLMSWNQLHDILWGLMLFVTGAGKGGEHFRVLNFDVDDIRTGKLAYGTLRHCTEYGAISRRECRLRSATL